MNEFRSASLVDAEVKGRTVAGYAAVYDSPWNERLIEELGYVETLARGAFRKALGRSKNVPLLWQHEHRDMLATTGAGTLRLREDGRGLAFEADLPDNPLGEYVRSMVERGDVGGMSYGIQSRPEDSTVTEVRGQYQRRINDVHRLLDVSLTYEPSYEAATVELRSTGFAALSLQEILGGMEEQTEDAAAEVPSLEAGLFRRQADLRLAILEQGGILP
jgi:hypothetical protein